MNRFYVLLLAFQVVEVVISLSLNSNQNFEDYLDYGGKDDDMISIDSAGEFARSRRVLNTFRKNYHNSSKLRVLLEKAKQEEKKLEDLRQIQDEYSAYIYRKYLAYKVASSVLQDFITLRY